MIFDQQRFISNANFLTRLYQFPFKTLNNPNYY
jgi:hypothetical protein